MNEALNTRIQIRDGFYPVELSELMRQPTWNASLIRRSPQQTSHSISLH